MPLLPRRTEGVALQHQSSPVLAIDPDRRRRLALAAVLVALTLALSLPVAAEDDVKSARRSREDARAAQARAAAQIDVLSAEDASLAKGVSDIAEAVASQQGLVQDATRVVADAEQVAAERHAGVAATDAELAAARAKVAGLAVESYIGRRFEDAATVVLESSDASTAVRRAALLDLLHGSSRDALEVLRGVEAERADALAAASAAVAETAARRDELHAALAELEARLATQTRLRAELQRRIDGWQREQDELEAEEARLTELIKKRQLAALGVSPTEAGAASMQGFVLPAKGALGSGFGPRMHPIYRVVRMHNGVDLGGRTGDPVFASKTGEVLFAATSGGYGNVIILEHAGGVSTVYAHLSKIGVTVGERVATGEAIGLIGSTGLSTGPHLHFEVRVGGVPKNPELFLP
jgi:murein DD-endopeptidase MepM/ murein hydrolase activator NlpD